MVGFQNGHHAIIKDGVVVIEDDRILHVGRSFDGQVDQTIDASGKLVSPGFINIHGVANLDIQTLALDSRGSAFTSPKSYAVAVPISCAAACLSEAYGRCGPGSFPV